MADNYDSIEIPPHIQDPRVANLMKHANIFHRRALYDALIKRQGIGTRTFMNALPQSPTLAPNEGLDVPVPMPSAPRADEPLVRMLMQRGMF